MVQPATAPSRDSSFGRLFSALLGNVERVIQGKRGAGPPRARVPARRGPPPHRGRPRRRQDLAGQGDRPRRSAAPGTASSSPPTCCPPTSPACRCGTAPPTSSSSGPAASSPTSSSPTRSTGRRPRPSRRCSRRWRSARSRSTPHTYPLAAAVHGHRHPEPHRARGHLSPARGPARPLPHAHPDGLPRPRGRGRDPRGPGRATRAVDSLTPVATAADVADGGVDASRRCTSRPSAARLHARPRRRDPPSPRPRRSAPAPGGRSSLQRAARALAASFGRDYVLPDDVKRVAPSVLEHRLLVAPDAQLRGVTADDVVRTVLASVPVPGATGG